MARSFKVRYLFKASSSWIYISHHKPYLIMHFHQAIAMRVVGRIHLINVIQSINLRLKLQC